MKCYSYKELRWMGKGGGLNKFLHLKRGKELRYSELKITAGQRTMSGLIADLTSQTLILPVILTGHFRIGTLFFHMVVA